MKKKFLIASSVIIVLILMLILLYQFFIYSWTPIVKERSDFNDKELTIIENELNFELSDGAKIVNSHFDQGKDTSLYLWIEGIKDKDDFIKRNGLIFQKDGKYNTFIGKLEYAELYTTPNFEDVKWFLYENGNTWSAFLESSHIGPKTFRLFDKAKNQFTKQNCPLGTS